jgi:hypothetical protein
VIVFDLKCTAGHVFEAWFGSSADFAAQQERGLVRCPVCDCARVGKAVMAPRLGQGAALPAAAPAVPAAPDPAARAKAMLAALAQAQAELLRASEWVGARFVEEARAIHHGDAAARAIHGAASAEEAVALVEEGIALLPLPLPVLPPDDAH